MTKKIPVPTIATQYINIYTPKADFYDGIDTKSFKNGEFYNEWITNDFTVIKKENVWHIYGITHPKVPGFTDAYTHNGGIHEAENQLFHCSYGGKLEQLINGDKLIEHKKILYPQERPDERPECWAPCMIEKDSKYYLFYTPETVRLAITEDMFNFNPKRQGLFSGAEYLRDPYIFYEDGLYTMIYVTDNLYSRVSKDLINWSEERLFQANPFNTELSQESPCLFKRNGIYYLMWCIYDGQNGCYDERTFVFASEDINGFSGKTPITMLKGHAPEIVCEYGNYYIISVFYPNNGLNIAKIEWE